MLTLLSWSINSKSWFGTDDANIYFVYMKNFSNGHGFVYNVGGEKVEGFTSLLWTLIGSVVFYFSSSAEKLLIVLNILLITFSLYKVVNYIDELANESQKIFSKQSILFLLIIAVTPGFIDWTVTSLLETGLWCFLLTITTLKIIQYDAGANKINHYVSIGLLFALLILCRPESMLWVPLFIILNLIREYYNCGVWKTSIWLFILNCIVFYCTAFRPNPVEDKLFWLSAPKYILRKGFCKQD